MNNGKTGHFGKNTGHSTGTLPRARARPFGEDSEVSHCPSVPNNGTGQLFERDKAVGQDKSGFKAGPVPSSFGGWMQIAAMNLLADHRAGLVVDARRLDAAKQLLGVA